MNRVQGTSPDLDVQQDRLLGDRFPAGFRFAAGQGLLGFSC
jgi:hypothetical protein